MSRRTFRLKAISLAVAYAVALQGLFAAFVPIAMALPAGMLCSGDLADAPAAPHEPSCTSACAMLGGVGAPPPLGVFMSAPLARTTDALCLFGAPLNIAPKGPQAARAPPSA
jgi:hypothetical protein